MLFVRPHVPEPMTLHILGKPYRVDRLPTNQLPTLMGSTNRGRQVICLDETLAADQAEDTLLHEVLHIIDGELALNFSEETIQRLSVGLYSAGYRREAPHA